MRRFIVVMLALVAACSGDSTGPSNPFPNVAGVYAVAGGFDGISSDQAHFSGTLTLNQASQQSGTLTGSGQVTATINGQTLGGTHDLTQASVSTQGVITFVLQETGASWTFTGQQSGTTIVNGRHTITDGTTTLSGNWQGTRQ